MPRRSVCLGIDLGNSYICCGVWNGNRVEMLQNEQGSNLTPAFVSFTPEGAILIGDAAKSQMTKNPKNTLFDLRRLLGATFADIKEEAKLWPFAISPDATGRPRVHVTYKGSQRELYPEQLCALVLAKMRRHAEQRFGQKVTDAVVTVPAHFSDAQRRATRDAALIAGLTVLRILNAPTAAAVAFCLDSQDDTTPAAPAAAAKPAEQTVLVFSLSGGSCDASLVVIEQGVLEVRATAGDNRLGGEDFDNRLVAHAAEELRRVTGVAIDGDARALSRLRGACERAKCLLSSSASQRIVLEGLCGGKDLDITVTRAQFEQLCADLIARSLTPVDKVLEDAGVQPSSVHEVVVVGGASRIPRVQQLLSDRFGGRRLTQRGSNPDESVARGAAIEGAILCGEDSAKVHDMLLLDIAPFTLGVAANDGRMAVVIPRNTCIPARKEHTFALLPPGAPNPTLHLTLPLDAEQRSVAIRVCEGESALAAENEAIGLVVLTGLPDAPPAPDAPAAPAPDGGDAAAAAAAAAEHPHANLLHVRVVFDLDADCVLTVHAEEASHPGTIATGRVVMTNESGHLPREAVARMAAEHEAMWDDAQEREGGQGEGA